MIQGWNELVKQMKLGFDSARLDRWSAAWKRNTLEVNRMLKYGAIHWKTLDALATDVIGRRVVVCGSGYSLFEYVEQLRQFQEKGFVVFAPTSALKFLLAYDITPDVVFLLDSCPELIDTFNQIPTLPASSVAK